MSFITGKPNIDDLWNDPYFKDDPNFVSSIIYPYEANSHDREALFGNSIKPLIIDKKVIEKINYHISQKHYTEAIEHLNLMLIPYIDEDYEFLMTLYRVRQYNCLSQFNGVSKLPESIQEDIISQSILCVTDIVKNNMVEKYKNILLRNTNNIMYLLLRGLVDFEHVEKLFNDKNIHLNQLYISDEIVKMYGVKKILNEKIFTFNQSYVKLKTLSYPNILKIIYEYFENINDYDSKGISLKNDIYRLIIGPFERYILNDIIDNKREDIIRIMLEDFKSSLISSHIMFSIIEILESSVYKDLVKEYVSDEVLLRVISKQGGITEVDLARFSIEDIANLIKTERSARRLLNVALLKYNFHPALIEVFSHKNEDDDFGKYISEQEYSLNNNYSIYVDHVNHIKYIKNIEDRTDKLRAIIIALTLTTIRNLEDILNIKDRFEIITTVLNLEVDSYNVSIKLKILSNLNSSMSLTPKLFEQIHYFMEEDEINELIDSFTDAYNKIDDNYSYSDYLTQQLLIIEEGLLFNDRFRKNLINVHLLARRNLRYFLKDNPYKQQYINHLVNEIPGKKFYKETIVEFTKALILNGDSDSETLITQLLLTEDGLVDKIATELELKEFERNKKKL